MCAYMKRENFAVSPVYLVALSIVPHHHKDKYLIKLLKLEVELNYRWYIFVSVIIVWEAYDATHTRLWELQVQSSGAN